MTEQEKQIEDAEINYSPVWRISGEVFTKKASELLNMPIERVEVRRCIAMGIGWGKLTVYVYQEDDDEKAYYRLHNGSTQYVNLSPNIYEFQSALEQANSEPESKYWITPQHFDPTKYRV